LALGFFATYKYLQVQLVAEKYCHLSIRNYLGNGTL
jgi:hypothetical protein